MNEFSVRFSFGIPFVILSDSAIWEKGPVVSHFDIFSKTLSTYYFVFLSVVHLQPILICIQISH